MSRAMPQIVVVGAGIVGASLAYHLARMGAPVTVFDADRWPIVGSLTGVEGVYIAVMHSGVTMAPLIGRLAAEEIVREETSELLQPFWPGRFAQTTPG